MRAGLTVRRVLLRVRGTVQGVGFRPAVCRHAAELGLAGFVRNVPGGVEIEAEGTGPAIARLCEALHTLSARACIESIEPFEVEPRDERGFAIRESRSGASEGLPLLPDLATCDACMAEILDPRNRRYRHAFASCTACGPRWSIATALPWDRARTAMAAFEPCRTCRDEHDDASDARRFHAQTLACPRCGPRLSLRGPDGSERARDQAALRGAAATLRAGGTVALRGLGGFQLLVDARDESAVQRLRKRKARPHKPLAVVVADAQAASALVAMSERERDAFASPAGPIVLARRRPDALVADSVAPGVAWLGVMRATTPLHRLLLDDVGAPLIATSGNRSGEPLCADDEDALSRLADVADAFLTHDRAVLRPVDDSVVRQIGDRMVTLRCARGLAPLSLPRRRGSAGRVALGGDLKAAPAVAAGDRILLGPHVGDVVSLRSSEAVARAADSLIEMSGADAASVVTDAHPDARLRDVARAWAGRRGARTEVVLHHHAHVLGGWAEHDLPLPVLGVAWDGAGYGQDRSTWGGEILRVDEHGVARWAHLRRFPLPGGDAAAREPRRAALGLLFARFGADAFARREPPLEAFDAGEREALLRVLVSGRFAPEVSSAGRLFDAAASLLGLRQRCSYEGQAALELESLAIDHADEPPYPIGCEHAVIDWAPLIDALLSDREAGVPTGIIAARLHHGLARGIVDATLRAAEETGIERVLLTGGCFQNALLSSLTETGLAQAGLEPLLHERVPPNDGGLAVGQLHAVGCAPDDLGV